jgi:hypothetical protein
MKILQLALKKLDIMLGNDHVHRERSFEKKYLDVWYSKRLTLIEIPEFCICCESFDIKILGFETSYESEYGLHTFGFELYTDKYYNEWWYEALNDLKIYGIVDCIIPYIHIDATVLDKYLNDGYE